MNQPIASESALSTFFRNLPDTLRQPFSLALVGSVAAHLFFFLWLPLFTSEEAKPEVKRVVRLLNSPSQTQASTSAIGLPPIPKMPDSTVKIPLGQGLLPPIPPDASLYRFQDPIIPPAPPIFRFSSPTTVFPNPILSRTFNPPPSLVRPNPTTIPNPTQTPLTTPPPSGGTDTKIPLLPSGVVPSTTTPAAPSTTPPTSTTPATISPAPTRPRVFAENQRLRDSITFKSPGATPNEVAANNVVSYGNWFKKNVIDRGIIDKNLATKNIPVPDVPYRSPFNLTEKFEPAYINVLVAPDGNIAAPLTVVGRTGYGILDALALDEVSKLVITDQKAGKLVPTGDDAGKYVLYKYVVTFKVSRTA
ncbi:MAG: hypothetical protein LH702_13805 [Phormidesmis sp. CAN_BIN44]|nr:hypothetical protein [Phormidesmis sp. CAN_BIN44]